MSKTTANSAAASSAAAKSAAKGSAAQDKAPGAAAADSAATTPARSAPKSTAKSRASAAAAAARAIADVPEASTAASRFADRFAPSKPVVPRIFDADLAVAKPSGPVDPKLANAWKNKEGRNLSEAELMAMPEAEYMNDKQLDFFRARLTGLKDDLLSNADETTEHLREDTSIVPDPADRATIEEEHALELRTRDRERKLLKKISQSLTRIDSGEYGFCDETGEPIGLGRLLARPTATLSLEAQQRREMKQKMFGD